MNELLEDKQLQKIHKGKKIDLPLEEKIKKIKLNNSSHSIFSDQKIKESYKELKKMRDRVIHLKKTYTLVEDQDKWRQIINQDIDYPKIAYDLLMRLYKSTNDIRLDWIKKIEIG
jgi:ABC-type phosphate/phosphonate transport system ATPase subunit